MAFDTLNDLQNWYLITSGKIKSRPISFNVSYVVNKVVARHQVTSQKKEIKLISGVDTMINVFTDENMLNSIIDNLVVNAIKFSHPGSVVAVMARILSDDFLEIVVIDQGIGMSRDILDKLFDVSEDISVLGTQKEKGTGLGLINSKLFVEECGGIMYVESEEGNGSKFKFTIPLFKK